MSAERTLQAAKLIEASARLDGKAEGLLIAATCILAIDGIREHIDAIHAECKALA
jgi:hypothetical protein